MANLLKMAIVESIRSLFAQGWSQRRIARELGVDRETVRKYASAGLCGDSPTGLGESKPATFSSLPAPGSKPATNPPTGSGAKKKPKPAKENPPDPADGTCKS